MIIVRLVPQVILCRTCDIHIVSNIDLQRMTDSKENLFKCGEEALGVANFAFLHPREKS